MTGDILKKIYAAKALQLENEMRCEPYGSVRDRALASVPGRRPFLAALEAGGGNAIVAEIKRASPSAGLIARDFDPIALAQTYERAGVEAISILTEADHFLGDIATVPRVRAAVGKPLLRKDFLTTPYQVAQSAAYGADCILLIVNGLTEGQLHDCVAEAQRYSLDVLAEVHDSDDVDRALLCGVKFVGVNNRNLRTMETDLAVSEHLLPALPEGVFAISESGMRSFEDVERLRKAGARGFLIGEALMRSANPADLIASFKRVHAN
ncbi:MAG: indole-3-glycerol phosphate synthase TrpC [Candidatus Eremiobacteraeota bacterium]|nr:indole-3-glycerol phosphate synthase TrpC [Candidatus Eremiobacteraeota bacterium]